MKKEVVKYLVELLNYLDGRGIIFTDEGLVKEALKDCGGFKRLRDITK